MSTFRELDLAEIGGLGTPSTKRGKSGPDPSIRTVLNWFKFSSAFGFCSNPNCPDDRPRKVADGNAMVAEVDGTIMCRICFVAGYDGT